MATIYYANGDIEEIDGTGRGKQVTLPQAQQIVGGWIQAIWIANDQKQMVVNEDGISLKLKPNGYASRLAGQQILGDALVVTPKGADWY